MILVKTFVPVPVPVSVAFSDIIIQMFVMKEVTMLSAILLVFCTVAYAAKYSNSVLDRDFPDPTVMKASNGYYYVYGTQGSGCRIQVAQSTNLIDWKWLGEALPHPPSVSL